MGHSISTLGSAKRDIWGLGAELWFFGAHYAFAKMILQNVLFNVQFLRVIQGAEFLAPFFSGSQPLALNLTSK